MLFQSQIQKSFQINNRNNRIDPASKRDALTLDKNEQTTIQKAFHIGLGDKETRDKFFQDGLKGNLTPFQVDLIKEIQMGLKEDRKYTGKIDGLFGPESTAALRDILLENKIFKEAKDALNKSDCGSNALIQNIGEEHLKKDTPVPIR